MSDKRSAEGALYETLRYEAEELWPKGMEPVPGVEYEATAKRVCDLMRSAADEIERLRADLRNLERLRVEWWNAPADSDRDTIFNDQAQAITRRSRS